MGWYLRQILPIGYHSPYVVDGRLERCTWRMWFGRCFRVRRDSVALPT